VGLSPPLFLFWQETQNSKERKKRGKRDGPRTDNTTISVTLFFQRSLKSPSSITMLTSRHKISPIMATWQRDEYHGECRVVAWIFTIRRRPLIFYVEKRSQTYFHATV
jgi:hypothetical protein